MLVGLLVVLAYAVMLLLLQRRSGVPYTQIADSEANTRRGILVPVAIALAALLAYAAATGRLAGAFAYAPTISAPWLWIVPGLIVAGILIRFASTDWRALGARRVLTVVVASLLVGTSEELLIRGLFLHDLQASGLSPLWVAVVSSVVFGVLHGMNILTGQDVQTTLAQVISTTFMGLAFFTTLALTGTLWAPILLHALFDLSLLAQGSIVKEAAKARPVEIVLNLLPMALSIGVLFVL